MKKFAVIFCTLALVLGTTSSVALATPIPNSGITAYATSQYENLGPANTIDGIAGNDGGGAGMWLSAQDDLKSKGTGETHGASVYWDLGAIYTLGSANIWNYNQYNTTYGDFTKRGMKDVYIYVSNDGLSWTLVEHLEFAQASGAADYPGFTHDFVGGVTTRWVGFAIDDNWGDPGYVGLSEVQFNAAAPVPEPATMFLLGSGLIGVGVFVRRKFKK
jgi:hypothetical protein